MLRSAPLHTLFVAENGVLVHNDSEGAEAAEAFRIRVQIDGISAAQESGGSLSLSD